ncbi:MAG: AMP-binding protein [Pseudomonadota bacterium]
MSILTQSLAAKVSGFDTSLAHPAETVGTPLDNVSHVRGPTEPALVNLTIPQLLRECVTRFGARDAVIIPHQGVRRNYEAFARDIDDLATGLLALGLETGDRVGIWSPNRYEWLLTQFATARVGLILVNINPAYRLAEVEYALNKVGCKALIAAEAFKSSNYLGMIRQLAPELERCEPGRLCAETLPHLRHVIGLCADPGPGIFPFDTIRTLGGPAQHLRLGSIDARLDPQDAVNIQFTSGTTGAPKGATLSHHNIVNNARSVTDRILLTESDRLCIPVPLYHCFGMVMGVLGAVSKGAAIVFPGEGFEARTTLEALSAERCTALYGVPTMFVAMLEEMANGDYDLSPLRTGIMAGAPCPIEVMRRVNAEMSMDEVTICYGMTETSPVSFQSFVDDPIETRCATVGRIHPHLEAKIIDSAGATVPIGEQGELCTRGYSVMLGYWDDADKTAESLRDGWMHTGDLARIDADGFCTITGRVKDMIIRGGENISPREIEEFLFRHPKISEAQVFGIPDDTYGEEVCAWVIAKPGSTLTEDEVRAFCKGQIAHYKVPKHIRLVDQTPMTITGKPQKFLMRDQMIEMLEGT